MLTSNDTSAYFSACGGLWLDRSDWHDALDARRSDGTITTQEQEDLTFYATNGYVVFPKAVPEEIVDDFRTYFDGIWTDPPDNIWMVHGGKIKAVDTALVDEVTKVADVHYFYPAARDVVFPKRVKRFLELLYQRAPVIFQSMTTRKGTEEPLHTDTGPLGLTEPMSLVASWLALEDVREGSGELQFVPGSHRVPELLIDGVQKYHEGDMQKYHEVLESARAECAKRGLTRQTFKAKKGDILIWTADLLHGGLPISNHSLTRKSFICHFMPHGVKPIFYDATSVEYLDYGNQAFYLNRFNADEVAAYNARRQDGSVRATAQAQ